MLELDEPTIPKACGSQACVRVTRRVDKVEVEDTKLDDGRPVSFPVASWRRFTVALQAGEFDDR